MNNEFDENNNQSQPSDNTANENPATEELNNSASAGGEAQSAEDANTTQSNGNTQPVTPDPRFWEPQKPEQPRPASQSDAGVNYDPSHTVYTGGSVYGRPVHSDNYATPTPQQPRPQSQRYGNVPFAPPVQNEPKKKKGISKGIIAVIVAACIVLSFCCGIGGAYVVHEIISDVRDEKTDNSPLSLKDSNDDDDDNSDAADVKYKEGTVAAATQKASPSVVVITTEHVTNSMFYGQYITDGAGSGVIIDEENGYIITCAHVVEDTSKITVTLNDGTQYDATLIGSDTQSDIAIIKIEAEGLVAAELGDSDNLIVGETAIAIGNPLGVLGGTVSSGIISALDREIQIDGQVYNLLQIDTSINPGNSGGGLFDIEGKLIGVVNAKSSGSDVEGLGFAIPINSAIEISSDLVDNGYVTGRCVLGISGVEVTSDSMLSKIRMSQYSDLLNYIDDYGVYFLEYTDGQTGDLKFGDRIVAIDDTTVSSLSAIAALLEEYSSGDKVTVTVSRMDTEKKRSQMSDIEVTLIDYVPESAAETN